MTLGNAISKRILNLCEEHKISLNRLSNICGITQSTLNNIISGVSQNPTVSTVQKICEGLDITLVQFFDDELFLNIEKDL